MMPVDHQRLISLINRHLRWYPRMELRDVYKLIYQGVMGSEHLIESVEGFTEYLFSELASVPADPDERLLEPIRPDDTLVRLNLRPYKSRHLAPDQLIPLLIETSRLYKGTKLELQRTWEVFTQICQERQVVNFDINTLQQFTQRLEELDYPAMHHSETYSNAYQPAYRLIAARFIPSLGLADAS
jgi:hypothetical protein